MEGAPNEEQEFQDIVQQLKECLGVNIDTDLLQRIDSVTKSWKYQIGAKRAIESISETLDRFRTEISRAKDRGDDMAPVVRVLVTSLQP